MLTKIWEEMAEIELGGSGGGHIYTDKLEFYKAHIRKWDTSFIIQNGPRVRGVRPQFGPSEIPNHSANCDDKPIEKVSVLKEEIPRWKRLMMDALKDM